MTLSQRRSLRSSRSTIRVSLESAGWMSFFMASMPLRIAPSGLRNSWLTVPVTWPTAASRSLRTSWSWVARSSAVRFSTLFSRFWFRSLSARSVSANRAKALRFCLAR